MSLPSDPSDTPLEYTADENDIADALSDAAHAEMDDAPWISDDLVPDNLVPDEPAPAVSPKPPRNISANQPEEGATKVQKSASLSPTISSRSASQREESGVATSSRQQKHSAELFPIPPRDRQTGDPQSGDTAASSQGSQSFATGPLSLVETAFLASAASLIWLVSAYFPSIPFLRILFPLPIALMYLRWNVRAAWMTATVAGLLLTILLGPTRSIFFVMPYAFLGVQLGCLWRRQARWEIAIVTGALLVALGTFFRIWLLSILAGEDLWGYLVAQITQLIDWVVLRLTNWGWISLGALGQPRMEWVAVGAVVMVLFASLVYLFTVHLAAWLMLERLGVTMPDPPGWVKVLIDE